VTDHNSSPSNEGSSQPAAGADHWLVRSSTIRLLWIGFVVVLAATLVPDLFMDHHGEFALDGTIGFGAWFGFVSCVALVFGSIWLGRILKRRDSYYDS
jgi:hypothetical protein